MRQFHFAQGNYGEVEALYQRSLEITERSLGPDRQDLAPALNNLAMLYRTIGRLDESERLFGRALVLLERSQDADPIRLARSLDYMVGVFRLQGKYLNAEQFGRRTLAIKEKHSGQSHPEVATPCSGKTEAEQNSGRGTRRNQALLFVGPVSTKKRALKNFFKAFVLIPAMTYSPTQFPGQYHWR